MVLKGKTSISCDQGNYKIHLDTREGEAGNHLVLSNIDTIDSGEYVCSVSTYKRTEIKHRLTVKSRYWKK